MWYRRDYSSMRRFGTPGRDALSNVRFHKIGRWSGALWENIGISVPRWPCMLEIRSLAAWEAAGRWSPSGTRVNPTVVERLYIAGCDPGEYVYDVEHEYHARIDLLGTATACHRRHSAHVIHVGMAFCRALYACRRSFRQTFTGSSSVSRSNFDLNFVRKWRRGDDVGVIQRSRLRRRGRCFP